MDFAPLGLAVAGVSAIVALRHLLLAGAGHWLARRLRPSVYRPETIARRQRLAAQLRREIGWSLLSALVYGAPAAFVLWLWLHHDATRLYADPGQWPLWWLPLSVLVYLVAHDTFFYWTHRALHASPRLFRWFHAVHHEGRQPTAFTAMAFHPGEAMLVGWFVPALTFVVPIHVGALGFVLALASLLAVGNHMGAELLPRRWVEGWLGRHLITACHHQRHHRELGANFGLYFRWWDRALGTDRGLSGEPLARG